MSTYIPAWTQEEGGMKPSVTHIHVIPLEDKSGLLHCAQQHCWCSPVVDQKDSRLVIHNAMTAAPEGWVNIAENRARAALTDGPAVSGDSEPASVTAKTSDQLYVLFASLEWKLGCHLSEWKAARELAYRRKAGDELSKAHCDGVVRLLREHLEAYGKA